MRHRFFNILLLVAFVAIILQPIFPFVQYYYGDKSKIVNIDNPCDCNCGEPKIAKMANNGDAYLRALIKLTCNDKKHKMPKTPTTNSVVFIKVLIRDYSVNYHFPDDNFNEISDFIIQPSLSTYLNEILRPPKNA